MFDHADDPRMDAVITRLVTHTGGAIDELAKLEAGPDFTAARPLGS